jgi:uncharacterized membrane protein
MTHRVTKSIIVQGDIGEIFNIWADFQNFPHFMKNIKSVTKTGPDTSHWVMKGLLGKTIEWDAKTTRMEQNTRVAWNSREGGDITTSGQVTFNQLPQNQVEVTVTLQYVPPAGKVGEAMAALFTNPDKKLEDDLKNFKAYVERMPQQARK